MRGGGVVVVAVLLAGCGGGGDGGDRAETLDARSTTTSTSTTSTTEPVDAGGPVSQEQLEEALLALDDMPTGYSVSPPDEDENDTGGCGGDFTEQFDTEVEVEANYQAGLFGPFVFHSIGHVGDRADELIDAFAAFVEECREFDETDDEGNRTTGRFEPLSFPQLGDRTFAARVSGEGGGVPFVGDVVVMRHGSVVSLVALVTFGSEHDAELLERLARTASERADRFG